MRIRLLLTVVVAVLCVPAGSASAASRTETDSAQQTTATFTYDYKRSRFGTYDFSNLRIKIVRDGAPLVDSPVEDLCNECGGWPADMGSKATSSVTVRDLDADMEPEVLLDLYSGGANCCWYSVSWRFDADHNLMVKKVLRPGLSFPYTLKDLNSDGVPEFKTLDYRFAYKYGSNADTPRPLRIFQWDAGKLVDTTISFPKLAAADAAEMYKLYLSVRKVKKANLRGVLAAYVADSYNAHNGPAAYRRVVAAYRRGELDKKIDGDIGPFGRSYLISLRKFLKKLGYLRHA
jgi:hypothetical protein